MIAFAITPYNIFGIADGKTCYVSAAARNPSLRVYERLTENGLAHIDEALKASGWCEHANVGETYEGKKFTIEVVEIDE